jgi:hypothetical protein
LPPESHAAPEAGRTFGIWREVMMKKGEKKTKATQAALDHMDELLDEALRGTFPSSDPVAICIEDNWYLERNEPRRPPETDSAIGGSPATANSDRRHRRHRQSRLSRGHPGRHQL